MSFGSSWRMRWRGWQEVPISPVLCYSWQDRGALRSLLFGEIRMRVRIFKSDIIVLSPRKRSKFICCRKRRTVYPRLSCASDHKGFCESDEEIAALIKRSQLIDLDWVTRVIFAKIVEYFCNLRSKIFGQIFIRFGVLCPVLNASIKTEANKFLGEFSVLPASLPNSTSIQILIGVSASNAKRFPL